MGIMENVLRFKKLNLYNFLLLLLTMTVGRPSSLYLADAQLSHPLESVSVTQSPIDLNQVLIIQNDASSSTSSIPQMGDDDAGGSRTYFGLSVTLVPGWIFIAAPKSNVSDPKFVEPGIVYRCKLGGDSQVGSSSKKRKSKCDLITFPEKACLKNKKASSWDPTCEKSFNGGSMTYDPLGKVLVVCSPTWNHGTHNENYFLRQEGQCRVLDRLEIDRFGSRDVSKFQLVPFSNQIFRGPDAVKYDSTIRWFFSGMGFSSHAVIPEEQNPGESNKNSGLLIGAPGVLYNNGSILWYKNPRDKKEKVKLLLPELLNNKTDDLGDLYYLGYAVTSGKFFSSETLVAAGSPRGAKLNGFVLLTQFKNFVQEGQQSMDGSDCFWFSPNTTRCQNKFFKNHTWTTLWKYKGVQFGSYFGSSLAATDVNDDGFDELFVGAPFQKYSSSSSSGVSKEKIKNSHNSPEEETGCVFIFTKRGSKSFRTPEQLCGAVGGARFGIAMATLNDINSDGFNDIAIGSPYEKERGAVYIYFGSAEGIHEDSSFLKIPASDYYHSNIGGFGSSLIGGVDIDGNHCPDFAVGDYKSEKVVIFRTRPLIKVTSNLTISVNGLDDVVDILPKNCQNFKIKICIKIEIYTIKNDQTPIIIPHDNDITLTAKITTDNRERRFNVTEIDGEIFQIPNHSIDIPLTFFRDQSNLCVNLSLVRNPEKLKVDDFEDEDPIRIRRRFLYNFTATAAATAVQSNSPGLSTHYTLSSGQEEGPEFDNFCPTCPSPMSDDVGTVHVIPIQNDNCTRSAICLANLSVTFLFQSFHQNGQLVDTFKGNGHANAFLMESAKFLKLTVILHNGLEYSALSPQLEVTCDPQFETDQGMPPQEKRRLKEYLTPQLTNHTLPTSTNGLTTEGTFKSKLINDGGNIRRNTSITHTLWLNVENLLAVQRAHSKLIVGTTVGGQNVGNFSQNWILDFKINASINLTGEDKNESWPLTPAHTFFGFNVTVNGTSPLILNLTVRFPMGLLKSREKNDEPNRRAQLLTVHPGNSGFKLDDCIEIGGGLPYNGTEGDKNEEDQIIGKILKLTVKNKILTFNCDGHDEGCIALSCRILIKKNVKSFPDKLQVSVKNNLTKSLMKKLDLRSIVFIAEARLQFRNSENSTGDAEAWTAHSKIVITLSPQAQGVVDLWILTVSGIGALVILLGVILALFKCGFFRRSTKEKLEALKAEAELEDAQTLMNRYGDQSQLGESSNGDQAVPQ